MRDYYWPLWRPVIGRDTLSVLAPVLGPQQKNWLYHPLPLLMAVSMVPNIWHSSCFCMRHSWLTTFGGYAWTSSYLPGINIKYFVFNSVIIYHFNIWHHRLQIVRTGINRSFVRTEVCIKASPVDVKVVYFWGWKLVVRQPLAAP